MREKVGGEISLPTHLLVFSQNGAALRTFLEWEKVVRFGNSELSRTQREMIAAVTSSLNGCVFCTIGHANKIWKLTKDEKLYEDLVQDYRQATLSLADHKMLDYAAKLTLTPSAMKPEDVTILREHGFSDAAIADIALNVSLMCAVNRMLEGLGMEVHQDKIEEAERLGMPIPPHFRKKK